MVAAEHGREFAWLVGGAYVRWGFTLDPVEGGTRLTESWQFRPAGLEMLREKFGDDADREIESRTRAAHEGIPVTLARIKEIAEQDGAHPDTA